MNTPRRPGRPRSEHSRRAVLEATAHLVAASGYEALTIEAIATRAGVSRQTIYRWWPSKASIVAEAVVGGAVSGFDPSQFPTGLGLRDLVHAIVDATTPSASASLVRGLAAAAAGDAADADALYEHSTRASHTALADAVRAAVNAGKAPANLDPEVAADQIIGALLYRVVARQPIPSGFADSLLANIVGPASA